MALGRGSPIGGPGWSALRTSEDSGRIEIDGTLWDLDKTGLTEVQASRHDRAASDRVFVDTAMTWEQMVHFIREWRTPRTHEEMRYNPRGVAMSQAPVVDTTPDRAAQTTEPAPDFNPRTYVHVIAAGLGVSVIEIPPEIRTTLDACTTQNEVNRLVMQWYKTRPEPVATPIDDEDRALFKSLVSPANSGRAREYEQNIARYCTEATSALNRANQHLQQAANQRSELEIYLGKGGKDLNEEMDKIVADGWYTYAKDKTRDRNHQMETLGHPTRKGIWFTTQPVTLTYFNRTAGVEQVVPMGKYLVEIRPLENTIKVHKYEGNITVGDYYHPHISTDSNVCWGNAAATYPTNMRALELAKVMGHLRIILTTYNDESPYRSLSEFGNRHDPALMYPGESEYKQYGSKCMWIDREDLPDDLDEAQVEREIENGEEDDDGDYVSNDRVLVSAWRLLIKGTQNRVPNTYYFVRKQDGSFYQVDERTVKGWG